MSHHHSQVPVDIDPQRATVRPGKLGGLLLALTALGVAGCAAGWMSDPGQFYHSYLTAYVWAASIVLGMLFFVMLHHLTDAGWSTVIRRPAEQVLAAMWPLAVLFVPIVIGTASGKLFKWVAENPHDELLAAKRPYLNLTFFFIRQGVYFALWLALARLMRGRSLRQDVTRDPKLSLSMRRWSAPGMILFALTFTLASFDWVMSLDYHWFSTIFGVYIYAGAVVAALATLSMMVLALDKRPLANLVSSDTLHDLGKLWWAFVVFWGYIAFSQYFLIWYGNIPEETLWFMHRWTGGEAPFDANWWIAATVMPAGMFVIPFVVMMPAGAKRKPAVLLTMGILILAAHWLDIWWLVMPVPHPHHMPLASLWMDASAVLAVGGLCAWVVLRALGRAPAAPLHDPRLSEALAGHDHHDEADEALPEAPAAGESR